MTRPSRRRALLAATASACLPFAVPSAVRAQAPWPSKPLRIMVGANAGGGTDIIARMLAEKLSAQLGQQVVVENRPGASNTIAADLTAKAPPDGHTLLAATNTGQAIAPHLIKLAFDPIKDISPSALIVEVPNVLVVSRSRSRASSSTRRRASAARSTSPARPSPPRPARSSCTCPTRAARRRTST
jgi:tripartite-type tricarboxylate transporter receptor subunit TctC